VVARVRRWLAGSCQIRVVGRWCWMRFDSSSLLLSFFFCSVTFFAFLFLVFDEMGLSYVED
jgi:hypothetical protein